jgi:type I restriction enzyme M protein
VALALKKSDLYSSLWSSADELRGGMDASQYKDYVLTLLFVKYVSDKAKADPYSLIVIPEGGSFDDLVAAKGKSNVGELVNIAIHKLAEKNNLVDVLKNADFDDRTKLGDGRDLVDRVSNLIGIFQDLDFSGSRAEGDDLLGDAYEYLMRHFATESGKSKGQFYTPAEVSRVMAQLLQIPTDAPKSATVYDPTCGSGSLLIKIADASPHGLTIYGQEKDSATWALARMNMILHGNETSDIRHGNTLADPKFRSGEKLDTFDYLVANPPFSDKSWKNGFENDYGRFDGFDTPPDKNGDLAFLLHMIKSLKSSGRGAVILPHGVLFRGNSEANIRKELIKRGYIKAIIGLPANLFYGTGIPACILVLDKKDAQARTAIFMIDASRGYAKDGPKNRLRPRDMHRIVDAFTKLEEIPRYSRMVPVSEIADAKNEYNLNIPRYIDSSDPEDIQDLHAHLQGGIPNRDLDALQPYWDAFPTLRSTLFKPLRDGYSELALSQFGLQATTVNSSEYKSFASGTEDAVADWWKKHRNQLTGIDRNTKPATLIGDLSEELLAIFRPRPLIDEYGVYEQLMSYWNDSMHDDVTMLISEGWHEASKPRKARSWKDRNNKTKYEDANVQVGSGANGERWVMDLVPPELIVNRFFAEDRDAILALTVNLERAARAIEEYVEEHVVEDGLLWEAADDEGKVTAKLATDRLKEARAERADNAEIDALEKIIKLFEVESVTKKLIKETRTNLDNKTLGQYGKLTVDDVKSLVIDDKWGMMLDRRINQEVTTLGQALITRLRELADRYESTVGVIEAEVQDLGKKVMAHLATMGVTA